MSHSTLSLLILRFKSDRVEAFIPQGQVPDIELSGRSTVNEYARRAISSTGIQVAWERPVEIRDIKNSDGSYSVDILFLCVTNQTSEDDGWQPLDHAAWPGAVKYLQANILQLPLLKSFFGDRVTMTEISRLLKDIGASVNNIYRKLQPALIPTDETKPESHKTGADARIYEWKRSNHND